MDDRQALLTSTGAAAQGGYYCIIFGDIASETTNFQAPAPLNLPCYFLTNPAANSAYDELEVDWQAVCFRVDPVTGELVGNTTRSVRQEYNQ